MTFGLIDEFLADPRGTLIFFLLAMPGRLLAISMHEAAHAWVADRCGDPTARMMGRVTLNPLKHLDPVGVLMMLVFGIGWARPVPVNPRNYRNDRWDDLRVSLAGIAVNLLLFLLGYLLTYAMAVLALTQIPYLAAYSATAPELFRTTIEGTPALVSGEYWYDLTELMRYGLSLSDLLVTPSLGSIPGYLYQMLMYFTMTNLVLAVFNLIPLPPLDGYHALNDLLLRRSLFASPKSQAIGNALLYIGVFTGVLTDLLEHVYEAVLGGAGGAMVALLRASGVM